MGELLDAITVGPGHIIRLQFDGTYYSADLSEAVFDDRNRFWLVLRTEAPAEETAEAVRRVAKLSARRNITTLIARAVPGVPLEYFETPPAGVPRRANTHYFRLDHASVQWLDIASSRTVSLFWDTAPADLVAELVVLGS